MPRQVPRCHRLVHIGKWVLVQFVCLLSGCGGSGSAPANLPQTTPPVVSDNLQMTLATDKSVYKAGEPVVYTLTLKNLTSSERILGDANYYFDVVQNATGQKLNLAPLTTDGVVIVLPPNGNNTLQDQWRQDYVPTATSPRTPVPPGKYTLSGSYGYLLDDPNAVDVVFAKPITTASLTITIQ